MHSYDDISLALKILKTHIFLISFISLFYTLHAYLPFYFEMQYVMKLIVIIPRIP